MPLEQVILGGIVQAEILRASEEVEATTFFSSANSPLQLGIMSHSAGFKEPAHYHPRIKRDECETQQFFIVTRGEIAVQFYNEFGDEFEEIILSVGDSILIKEGTHSIHVKANSRCITVKQGPFAGAEFDKILVPTK